MSFSEKCFSSGGGISLHLDSFEQRPQQIEMAKAVEDAIRSGRDLIVEAGTGVGKTLAYLVPFIVWAKENHKRVVVSTYTKALQSQLYVKDLPFLSKVLDIDFHFALCLGSDNYVCLRKSHKNAALNLFTSGRMTEQAEYILSWIKETDTGVMTDMEILPDSSVWKCFSRDPGLCTGRKCKWWDECFYKKARIEQSKSEVLITNHALLFTDVISDSKVLPEFDAIVMDEAHTIEDVATNYFGREVSKAGTYSLLDQIQTLVKSIKRDDIEAGICDLEEIELLVNDIRLKPNLFTRAGQLFAENNGLVKIDINDFSKDLELMHQMATLSGVLGAIAGYIKDPDKKEEMKACAGSCENTAESIDFIFNGNRYEYAYWLNIKTWKENTNYSFHAAPVDVSTQMKEFFFEKISPIVLTSATLTTGEDKFSFIKKRLGLLDPLELVLDSPFDYRNNVLIYLPEGKADPAYNAGAYKEHLKRNIVELYETLGGRIFCLFTSYEMLNYISAEILRERSDIELLRQGDMPRYVLLDMFKRNASAMLMGTTTFWQGVDVPGEALECVIITKLPFSVPTDPVYSARMEIIRKKGRQPFMEYQLPQAVIMFKQGFGRLIRTKTDRGVVAILDPRIKTRSYGKVFLGSLPECGQTNAIKGIKEFFSK